MNLIVTVGKAIGVDAPVAIAAVAALPALAVSAERHKSRQTESGRQIISSRFASNRELLERCLPAWIRPT